MRSVNTGGVTKGRLVRIYAVSPLLSCSVLLSGSLLSVLALPHFSQVQDLPLPPHNATSCKHNMWCRIQLLMTLYVVSSP
ncbi:hypothetical protein C2D57_24855 [Escherichia coli]|nr:hypothetical protein [Escherichia coli]EFO3793476.1 hypothetical protein [Escherichia coli]